MDHGKAWRQTRPFLSIRAVKRWNLPQVLHDGRRCFARHGCQRVPSSRRGHEGGGGPHDSVPRPCPAGHSSSATYGLGLGAFSQIDVDCLGKDEGRRMQLVKINLVRYVCYGRWLCQRLHVSRCCLAAAARVASSSPVLPNALALARMWMFLSWRKKATSCKAPSSRIQSTQG